MIKKKEETKDHKSIYISIINFTFIQMNKSTNFFVNPSSNAFTRSAIGINFYFLICIEAWYARDTQINIHNFIDRFRFQSNAMVSLTPICYPMNHAHQQCDSVKEADIRTKKPLVLIGKWRIKYDVGIRWKLVRILAPTYGHPSAFNRNFTPNCFI